MDVLTSSSGLMSEAIFYYITAKKLLPNFTSQRFVLKEPPVAHKFKYVCMATCS
jgi:hypothetical protein